MGDALSQAVVCSVDEDDAVCATTSTHGMNNLSSKGGNSPRHPLGRAWGIKQDPLIIFDWDDTLLCSSAIGQAQWNLDQLRQLEEIVEMILQFSMELGETMIVTNGNAAWVQESAHRFLPGPVPLLERIVVMSARAMFEDAYPGDPFSWKRQAFKHIMKCRRAKHPHVTGVNFIVLGDSPAEMEAAHSAAKVYTEQSFVKTVKFRETPSVTQLLGELQRVSQDLGDIVREECSSSRELEQVKLPAHLSHLEVGASGWKFGVGRDWSCSQTFLDVLFSKDADEDAPLELPDWIVNLADKMTTWPSTVPEPQRLTVH